MKAALVPINPRKAKILNDSDSEDLELDNEDEGSHPQIVIPSSHIQNHKAKKKQAINKENCSLLNEF